jgi:hypothetical protein
MRVKTLRDWLNKQDPEARIMRFNEGAEDWQELEPEEILARKDVNMK